MPTYRPGANCKVRDDFTISTHWGWDKMAAIFQTTFSNEFCWMKILKFRLEFHWSLFPRIQFIICQHWFRQWLGAGQVTSHYLNQWWLVYWRIYVSLGLNEFKKFVCIFTYQMIFIKMAKEISQNNTAPQVLSVPLFWLWWIINSYSWFEVYFGKYRNAWYLCCGNWICD